MFSLTLKILVFAICLAILPNDIFSSVLGIDSPVAVSDSKSPPVIHNSCGGNIEVKFEEIVVLEYKLNEEYENNEFCVWLLRVNNSDNMLITKPQSNFEQGFDFLQVSDMGYTTWEGPRPPQFLGNGTNGLEQLNSDVNLVYVIFSTDSSITGTGFRLEMIGYNRQSVDYLSDDFYTHDPSGSTTLAPYLRHSINSWVISPIHRSVPTLQLKLEYKLYDYYHYLSVYCLELNGREIRFRRDARWLDGEGNATFEAYYYTTFVVILHSDSNHVPPEGNHVTLNWYQPE